MTTLHMETDPLAEALDKITNKYVGMMDASEEIQMAGSGISSAFEGGGGYDLQGAVNDWFNRHQARSGDMRALIDAGWREIEEWLEADKNFVPPSRTEWEFFAGYEKGDEVQELTVPIWSGAIGSTPDGIVKWGSYEVGAKVGLEDGTLNAGIYGEFNCLEIGDEGVWGSEDLALTAGGNVKVGSVEGFAGIKNNTIGAEIGAYIVKAEGTAGVNVGPVNVGVKAGISLGLEFGFKIGQETEIKFGPFTLGFTIGSAKK